MQYVSLDNGHLLAKLQDFYLVPGYIKALLPSAGCSGQRPRKNFDIGLDNRLLTHPFLLFKRHLLTEPTDLYLRNGLPLQHFQLLLW